MTRTKADLAQILSKETGFSLKESTEIVDQVFELIKETLERGEQIKISGFGRFNVRVKLPRTGRNPKTGEKMAISGRKVVTFKPSPVLREVLKSEATQEEIKGREHTGNDQL